MFPRIIQREFPDFSPDTHPENLLNAQRALEEYGAIDGSITYDYFHVSDGKIEHRISKYMYVEMFAHYGIRSLCKIFCITDETAYSNLTKHVKFIRHSDLSCGDCCHDEVIERRAPLKTLLLRFDRIFAPNFALRKSRNTQSIPEFSQLNLGTNLSPKSSKKSF